MATITAVVFKEGGKTYYFAPKENEEYKVGEGVIVETSRGIEYATVTVARAEVDDGMLVLPLITPLHLAKKLCFILRFPVLYRNRADISDAHSGANFLRRGTRAFIFSWGRHRLRLFWTRSNPA